MDAFIFKIFFVVIISNNSIVHTLIAISSYFWSVPGSSDVKRVVWWWCHP